MSNENEQHTTVINSQQGNRPIDTLWDGSIKVAIFKNQRQNGVSFSAEAGRIYTDSHGQTQEAKSFSGRELLSVAKLSEKAYDRIGEFKQQMKSQQRGTERER